MTQKKRHRRGGTCREGKGPTERGKKGMRRKIPRRKAKYEVKKPSITVHWKGV